MTTPDRHHEFVSSDGLKEFSAFVLSHCEGGNLPDYKNMDLMRIPHLIPNIWVYDLRDEKKKKELLINFCGQKHNEMHGMNAMGKYDVDLFKGDPLFDRIVALYATSINQKKPAYTRRYKQHALSTGEKHWRYSEFIFFPCSSDGKTINWGIGCTDFDNKSQEGENIFLHFEYL